MGSGPGAVACLSGRFILSVDDTILNTWTSSSLGKAGRLPGYNMPTTQHEGVHPESDDSMRWGPQKE